MAIATGELHGEAAERARTAPEPDDPRKPDAPPDLEAASWKFTVRRAVHEFRRDQCTDQAAALTYFAVLAIFPAMLAIVSLLGVVGRGDATTDAIIGLLEDLGQEDVADTVRGPIESLTTTGMAGFGLAAGVVGALWSASAYVGAFGRSMNRIYEIDEGRPIWKLRPWNLAITAFAVIMAVLVLIGLVVSGPIARELGATIGVGDAAVTAWGIAKWPVMALIVVTLVAVLYHATPNVRQPRFRWFSVGAILATVVWAVGSIGFGFYVSNFGSYERTYGSLAGAIILLLWLWLTNIALLLGAELSAEMERARQLQGGIAAEETLQLPPRDDTTSIKEVERLDAEIEAGRELRLAATGAGGAPGDVAPDRADVRRDGDPPDPARRAPGTVTKVLAAVGVLATLRTVIPLLRRARSG